ncbi:ZIP family metal transporter [Vallitalea pronyensis]|uniref:ZIP family metal transporter n=1 Tax=Vallitalea pronyensis TaxID=1348613 RepID=A0A8J8MMC7_9FIRM|nr:ZIP family metal transporter [Vallitalea pronyensis]QUI23943.1 ZIP family metal transporter [Vallitalea pronyensis]
MMGNAFSFIVSLSTGAIGLTLGVFLTYSLSSKGKRFEGMMLAFTAGLMLSIVCFELLPKAFEVGGLEIGLLGICIGIGMVILIEQYLDHHKHERMRYDNMYIRRAILLAIAFSIHNIPEGIAIGSMLSLSPEEGLYFAFAILVHNVPEGMIIALPLKKSKVSLWYAIIIIAIISLFMGLGAMVGVSLSNISQMYISLSLAIASGIMLYVTTGEIIVKSMNQWKGRSISLTIILGILLGVILSRH